MARMGFHDPESAMLAGEAGGADAFYRLGLMYSAGKDVDVDLVAAHKWFNLAAMQGNREAREYRAELAGEMTADEIGEAQRAARGWLKGH